MGWVCIFAFQGTLSLSSQDRNERVILCFSILFTALDDNLLRGGKWHGVDGNRVWFFRDTAWLGVCGKPCLQPQQVVGNCSAAEMKQGGKARVH